jgi:hypothetical protein
VRPNLLYAVVDEWSLNFCPRGESGHSVVASGCTVLGRGQKNFSRLPAGVIKKANASRVGEAAVLEIENQVRAPVRQAATL